MALNFSNMMGNFEYISRKDDAIVDDITDDELEEYKKDFDKSKLRFKVGQKPTIFVVKKSLDFEGQLIVKNKMVGITNEGKAEFKLGATLEDVRCSLVDIINPDYVPVDQRIVFSKEKDGYASKNLIAMLGSVGIADEIYAARQSFAAMESDTKK